MSSRGEGESNSKARNEHLQPQLCRPCHLCKSVPLSSWDAPSSRTGSQLSTPAGHASVQDPRGHAASLGVPVPYTYVCCVPRGKDGRQTVLRVTTHLFHSLSLSIVHSSSSSPQHSEHNPRRDTLTHGQPQHPPPPSRRPKQHSDRRLFCCWGTWTPHSETVDSLVCRSAVVERGGGHGDPITPE